MPTDQPTFQPSGRPSSQPTDRPTLQPTQQPTYVMAVPRHLTSDLTPCAASQAKAVDAHGATVVATHAADRAAIELPNDPAIRRAVSTAVGATVSAALGAALGSADAATDGAALGTAIAPAVEPANGPAIGAAHTTTVKPTHFLSDLAAVAPTHVVPHSPHGPAHAAAIAAADRQAHDLHAPAHAAADECGRNEPAHGAADDHPHLDADADARHADDAENAGHDEHVARRPRRAGTPAWKTSHQ